MKITADHYKLVQDILSKYPYEFFVFGSRAKRTARSSSDLDLCYMDNIPASVLNNIQEAFEESNLPFKVDLVNWHTTSKDFKKLIEQDLLPLTELVKHQ